MLGRDYRRRETLPAAGGGSDRRDRRFATAAGVAAWAGCTMLGLSCSERKNFCHSGRYLGGIFLIEGVDLLDVLRTQQAKVQSRNRWCS